MYPILCMDCGRVTGHKAVEGSTSICDSCLERRYPEVEDETA